MVIPCYLRVYRFPVIYTTCDFLLCKHIVIYYLFIFHSLIEYIILIVILAYIINVSDYRTTYVMFRTITLVASFTSLRPVRCSYHPSYWRIYISTTKEPLTVCVDSVSCLTCFATSIDCKWLKFSFAKWIHVLSFYFYVHCNWLRITDRQTAIDKRFVEPGLLRVSWAEIQSIAQ